MTYHKTKCIFPDTPNCNINTLNPMYRSNKYVIGHCDFLPYF